MRKSVWFMLIAVIVLCAVSCTTFKASGLQATTAPEERTVMGNFRKTVWVNEFLGSSAGSKIFNVTADATEMEVTTAIQNAIHELGGTAAINITVEHQASFVNLLLNWLTCSIYAPSEVIVSGTVVK
jgi:hypothetical protein